MNDDDELLVKALEIKIMSDNEIEQERIKKINIFIEHGINPEDLIIFSALITESAIRMCIKDGMRIGS